MSEPIAHRLVTNPYLEEEKALSKQERAYYDKLEFNKRAIFLMCNIEDRKTLMNGQFSPEDEKIFWKQGSTRALLTINNGFVNKARVDLIPRYAKIFLIGALLCIPVSFYLNTYAKNKQMHWEGDSSFNKPRYELIVAEKGKIDNWHENNIKTTGLMSPDDFLKYVNQSDFRCGKIDDLRKSFSTDSGLPICTKTDKGDTWIAGYVLNNFPQPVLLVKHEEKLYNYDMGKDFSINSYIFPSLKKVNFDQIPYAFQSAFPYLTRTREEAGTFDRKQEKGE
ncbi:TPA: hypothetical protein QDB06_000754 [Burkholderia vietnamiensis]|nr:hypothetical protein [Burkholderia vietnamiensis]